MKGKVKVKQKPYNVLRAENDHLREELDKRDRVNACSAQISPRETKSRPVELTESIESLNNEIASTLRQIDRLKQELAEVQERHTCARLAHAEATTQLTMVLAQPQRVG